MPATFVLRGVRSPRTKASSVTCSTLPPSQAFQSRVSVTTTATASITTNNGVAYFSHGQRGGALGETGSGCGAGGWFELGVGAGVLAAAMVTDSFSAQKKDLFLHTRYHYSLQNADYNLGPRAIGGRGFSSKSGCDPIQLISQGPLDYWIMAKTGINISLHRVPQHRKGAGGFSRGASSAGSDA